MQTYAVERARDHCYDPDNFADCVNKEISKVDKRKKTNSGKRNLADEVTTALKISSFDAEFACKLNEQQYANSEECLGNCDSYRGKQSKSKTGKTCRKWSEIKYPSYEYHLGCCEPSESNSNTESG